MFQYPNSYKGKKSKLTMRLTTLLGTCLVASVAIVGCERAPNDFDRDGISDQLSVDDVRTCPKFLGSEVSKEPFWVLNFHKGKKDGTFENPKPIYPFGQKPPISIRPCYYGNDKTLDIEITGPGWYDKGYLIGKGDGTFNNGLMDRRGNFNGGFYIFEED